MRDQIEARRAELQAEYEFGQKKAAEMGQELVKLQQTMLRISGAIQLCNELLTQPPHAETEVDHGVDN